MSAHDQTPKPKRSIDRRRLILSIYWIRGLIYIVAILFFWYFVKPIVPFLMELTANRNAFVTIAFVLLGPLFAGWLGAKVINPITRSWSDTGGMTKLENRIIRELAPDEHRSFPVVLVPWPSKDVRSLALLTDTYPSPDGEGDLATVFIPETPNPRKGSLLVLATDVLEYTGWTFKDLLQYHWSYGSTGPELLASVGETQDE